MPREVHAKELERRPVEEKLTLKSFSDRTEEELIKSLFNDENKVTEEDKEAILTSQTSIHKARPGEE